MCREEGDFRKAVLWFKKSIAFNDESAYLQLWIHYYWGIGIRKNYKTAVRAFRKTARAKHIAEAERDDAFCYLAIAHLEGNGVRQSPRAAAKLLKRANIDNDHPAARLLLRTISSQ
jgi:TPR repeat protein